MHHISKSVLFLGAIATASHAATLPVDEPIAESGVKPVITAPAPDAALIPMDQIAPAPRGAEMTIQNDSLVDGGQIVLQFGFANGEIGAATYNIDPALFPLQIKRVQIYWSSALASGSQSLQDALVIYTGNFNLLAELLGPVLTDGALNEFDLAPLNIIINNPTPITVGMQFFEGPNGNALMPTLGTDNNGCQSGLNWVYIPGSDTWANLCAFGVSGDLVIRMVIDPMGVILPCPEDLNGDGIVDTADLGLLLAVFGQMPPTIAEADINGDGVADTADLGILLAAFDTACP